MTRFPSHVYRKVEVAGHFSFGTPNPGNPRAPSREDSGFEAPASRPELGPVFTVSGGLCDKPARAWTVSQFYCDPNACPAP